MKYLTFKNWTEYDIDVLWPALNRQGKKKKKTLLLLQPSMIIVPSNYCYYLTYYLVIGCATYKVLHWTCYTGIIIINKRNMKLYLYRFISPCLFVIWHKSYCSNLIHMLKFKKCISCLINVISNRAISIYTCISPFLYHRITNQPLK